MIVTVTLNPSVDHALFLPELRLHGTNRAVRAELDAGGKGINVSRVIHGMRGDTLATGFLGGGPGAFVRHTLDREGVPHDFVDLRGDTRIDISIETEDGRPPTCINEPGPSVTNREVEELTTKYGRLLSRADWVVLGGSHPPGTSPDLYCELGRKARAAGVPFALDADGQVLRKGIKAGPKLVKPNVSEASSLIGWQLVGMHACVDGALSISRMINSPDSIVVISRGADGAVMTVGGEFWIGRSPKVSCKSSVGSGDSMVAAMITRLQGGDPPWEALRYGLAAGAATAGKMGAGLASLEDVKALLPQAVVCPHAYSALR